MYIYQEIYRNYISTGPSRTEVPQYGDMRGISGVEINLIYKMERTLVILKPGCLQRGLVGEVISRFEKRGLQLVAMKMVQLDEEILKEHYAHLLDKPFFPWLRDGMMAAPVILCCWEGYNAVQVVRDMAGATRSSKAVPGTIRGDYSVSSQENIVQTSDSLENAEIELKRFFVESDYCNYTSPLDPFKYAPDEY